MGSGFEQSICKAAERIYDACSVKWIAQRADASSERDRSQLIAHCLAIGNTRAAFPSFVREADRLMRSTCNEAAKATNAPMLMSARTIGWCSAHGESNEGDFAEPRETRVVAQQKRHAERASFSGVRFDPNMSCAGSQNIRRSKREPFPGSGA